MVTSGYDEAEFAELDEAASRSGLTRASFQRVQSLAAPKTRSTRRAPVDREMLAKVLAQLGKIGSNMNQVGAAVNADRLQPVHGYALQTVLRRMNDEALPALLEALGQKAQAEGDGMKAQA
jgi:hypothetical protein